jgi:predicted dehydrogenase
MAAEPAPVRLAVCGAGLIGRRHIEHIQACPATRLAAIVDPAPAAQALAGRLGVPWHAALDELLASARPDGLVLATPTALHAEQGLAAVAAGIPALVEKPLAATLDDARRLVEAAEAANVPLLVGHHRRHNPLIGEAKRIVASGKLGRLVAVHAFFWIAKPAPYFDVAWRRQKGAGPVLTNLIHDVDLLRHLAGEIVSVQAVASNAIRGNEIEDGCAAILRFANGALGTVNASDAAAAPWSWEMTAHENPAYPATNEACYLLAGTAGSLSLPRLDVWSHDAAPDWNTPISATRHAPARTADPLALQIAHFADVVRGDAAPLVSGREGMKTLAAIDAILRAAESGTAVAVAQ